MPSIDIWLVMLGVGLLTACIIVLIEKYELIDRLLEVLRGKTLQ